MKNGSILVISNKDDVSAKLKDKIKLLREGDVIENVSYLESISVLNSTVPSVIVLYWTKEDSINIVKEIRGIKTLNKVPIIFVTDNLVEEFLFRAFDFGIDEFFYMNDPDSVILMRIFLAMQKSILYKKIDTVTDIMTESNIIDPKTGIYTASFSTKIMNYFFKKILDESQEDAIFLYVKPVATDKKYLNMKKITNIVKKVPRTNDVVAVSPDNSVFYIILYGTSRIGAVSVTQRLKKALEGVCDVYVNSTLVTASFDKTVSILSANIKSQIEVKNNFNFYYDTDINDFMNIAPIEAADEELQDEDTEKLRRQFEHIVLPVLYHYNAIHQTSLKDTVVNFNVGLDQSYFYLKNKLVQSKLVITFPMFTQIVIDISHKHGDEKPILRRETFNFTDFNEDVLSSVMNDFVNEHISIKAQKSLSE